VNTLRKVLPAAAVLSAAVLLSLCFAQRKPLYTDPAAPMEQRVEDLLSRMTLEEKVSQLMNDSPAIERLGIPAYNWWNECLHGVARAGRATVFPQTIGLAATWDKDLIFRVATAISDEARAKYHEFVRRGKRNIYQGLTFWTPNINLFRDPRWGRGMETYGEDPYLTGRMAVQFIKGLQGDDPKYLKTVATAKHYAVHSGPESLRHTFDAVIDERDLLDTYLPQFEAAVKEGGAFSVMCAYNRVDGQPACASPRLLGDILRKQWGFRGYVVSDCGAIGDIYLNHKSAPTAQDGVARAVQAGTDLNCGVEYENLLPAARAGLIAGSEIDQALRRLLLARFKLGMFDPPALVKYARIPYSVNDSPAHRQLALETARKSIVLLKNDGRALPLSKSLKTIAVIGPNANDPEVLLGNYNGEPSAPVTPLEGIRRKVAPGTKVLYARGSDLAANMPCFETVPSSALFTSNGPDRKNGLNAEYFATGNFDGKAHKPRELTYPSSGKLVGEIPSDPKPLFTRVDPRVDFHWWDGAPRRDMNDDDFGVRWTGYLSAPASGTYQLGANGMNAFELYLDGKPLVQFNNIHERAYRYAPVELQAGKLYQLRLDFHEFAGDADIQLVWAPPAGDRTQEAIAAARQADAVVLVLGLSPRLEGEEMSVPVEGFQGGDRLQLEIPRVQEELMQKVSAAGAPVVLVLMNGSAVAVNWARDHVPAIIEAWYPGQAAGDALADVLFGDYNPAGRLPVTFYKSAGQLPPFTDYGMKGRTYRFFEGEPLYPFGHGLSYTTFAYRNLSLPGQVRAGDQVTASVEVENTGTRSGEEVVQLYMKAVDALGPAPLHSLGGFERVVLRARERKTVQFVLSPRQFSAIQADGRRMVEPGTFEISAGGKQPGPLDAAASMVRGIVRIGGPAKELN
jgi:beta-glucosidase